MPGWSLPSMRDVFDSFFPALRRMLMLPASLRGESRSWRGRLAVLAAWPLFCIVQLLHWLGFLLDDVFFRGWRQVQVREPLFVLGPPRSGTTHLHHVLSNDERTTTFRMWECLFGLSVTGRRIVAGMARIDRAVGRPFGRLGRRLGKRLLADMDDVHPFAMDAPEEDFLALMPAAQCFILVIAFPNAGWLWRTARLDEEASKRERERLMRYYRACVQKHLHVHGPDRRFLSKNASFSGMAEALLETFPDARIMACTRDPKQTVPSQLSSIEPGLRAAGFDDVPESLRDRFIDLLRFYYEHLERVAEAHADRVVIVDNDALRDRLERTVKDAYRALDLDIGERFASALSEADDRSRGFRSGHSYSLSQYGLAESDVEAAFASVYDRRGFGRTDAEQSQGEQSE
ncbi:MAG: sulfotransferase [Candidatus Wenzhouxiangella sp. M2_3B_020]